MDVEATTNGSNEAVFLNDKSVEDYIKDVMLCVRNCQKLSGELAGWHHYRDYSGVERTMEQVNDNLTELVSNIFNHQDIKIKLGHHKLQDQFDMVREGNDALLEKINCDIDEAAGLKKNADAELLEPSVMKKVEGPSRSATGRNMVLLASRNVQKPQTFFSKKVDNSHKRPFLPLVEEKPNNIKPLSILLCIDDSGHEYYSHPYAYELEHWKPMPSQLEAVTPRLPNPIADTPIVMVETEEDLAKMISELKECDAFGFDLEHHSYRSYQGLACLLQISTREMDYIVDPFVLRGKLTPLNEVFTDPKITKIAHGTDHDIFWLQRDFGVYIVNLFDTHQAAIILEYPHRSLAALLARFCNVEADKVYQRADWRIRPLLEDFIHYARQDSHYLLYIFDLMRNELIEKGNQLNNLITAVYNRSAELCMRRYEKPIVGPESHMDIYRRSRKSFNSRQMFALQALYLWRDRVAREQDESTEYVLPKHMLLQIAEVLPKEMQGILACCNPIPPLVKTELLTIHTLIRESRQQPLFELKPSTFEDQLPLSNNQAEDDLGSGLISKHDLSQCEDNLTNLPTLINPAENLLGDIFVQHRITVGLREMSLMFKCLKSEIDHKVRSQFKISQDFISPYERYTSYLEMKPFLDGEKKKGGDQDRINRIMNHFLTLTENTETLMEAEAEERPFPNNQEEQNKMGQELQLPTLRQGESPQEIVKCYERRITHQAIDSFLESARKTTSSPEKREKTARDHVGEMLSQFRNLVGNINNEADNEDSENVKDEVKKPKKKKKKKPVAKILSEEMKVKKPKNKSAKRKSQDTADVSPPKKVKLDEANEKTEEKEDGEVSSSNSNEEDGETFDYDKADYGIFQKGKKKSFQRKFNQKFKGKTEKKRGGKSGSKSFT